MLKTDHVSYQATIDYRTIPTVGEKMMSVRKRF